MNYYLIQYMQFAAPNGLFFIIRRLLSFSVWKVCRMGTVGNLLFRLFVCFFLLYM